MRFDRTLSLYLGAPLGRLRGAGLRLPILMYHSISVEAEAGASSYYKVCTSPQRFREQMEWLAANGWHGLTLTEALARLYSESTPARRIFAITFDDGFRNFLVAAPILRACRFGATVYLPTAFIGQTETPANPRAYLTWREAAELSRSGIEFGAHTVHHRDLRDCSPDELRDELTCSKREIEDRLGTAVQSFACPNGFPRNDRAFARLFTNLLRLFGYESGVTTTIGRATPTTNRFLLPRLPVNEDDDVRLLSAKLNGAYDWLAGPQLITKVVRHLVSRSLPQAARRTPSTPG